MKAKGKLIVQFCDLYFQCYDKHVPDEGQEFVYDHRYLLFNLMDKLVELFSGVGELMVLADDKRYLKTSLFLVVRGALLDVIQAQWLISKMESGIPDEEQKNLLVEVDAINRDHLISHLFFLKTMNRLNANLSTESKYPVESELELINSQSKYSNIIGRKIERISEFNTKGLLIRKISDMLNETSVQNPYLRHAYINYSFYSKIEHTGILTSEIRALNYKENDPIDSYLNSSIMMIQNTIIILASAYFKDEPFVKKFKAFKIFDT